MANYITINILKITGISVPTVTLEFGNRITIITGGSDSGKTYLFNLIGYLFGNESFKNSGIKEAKKYSTALMQFTLDNITYTIERGLFDSGFYNLYKSDIDNFSSDNLLMKLMKTNSSKKSFYSVFYKELLFSEAKVRTNNSGGTNKVNLGMILRFFNIDEITILSTNSLILSDQYSDETRNKSEFKFLITQRDDSNLSGEKPNKKAKGLLKNQVVEVIDGISKDLMFPEKGMLEIDSEMKLLDESIEYQREIISSIIDIMDDKRSLIIEITEHLDVLNKKDSYLMLVNERFKTLELCYLSDLERVNAISQAGFFLESYPNDTCNNCGEIIAEIEKYSFDDYMISCEAEYNKINNQLGELKRTIAINSVELLNVSSEITDVSAILELEKKYYTDIKNDSIDEHQNILDDLYSKREALSSELYKHKVINSLEKKSELISGDSYDPSDFDSLSPDEVKSISDKMQLMLNDIMFNNRNDNVVSFNFESYDFIVNEKERGLYGKGTRAVIYACFVISLAYTLQNKKLPFPGVVILDSPLVTHYDKKRKISISEINPITLTDSFYHHVIEHGYNFQIIIIENKGPSFSVNNDHDVKIIDLNDNGSSGLFPDGLV
ncbi:Uncharacterised protein [Yersinia bercovieri]|uniref:hypothetical protein n=1 Tax=Yersinia bercovieri TaxID=634 RepID=UPI00061BC531|nr:hypothetical protein [Yersinia bercovieri]CNF73332.1 Uncharacterised protein [Yersinia bercovieri]